MGPNYLQLLLYSSQETGGSIPCRSTLPSLDICFEIVLLKLRYWAEGEAAIRVQFLHDSDWKYIGLRNRPTCLLQHETRIIAH